MIQCVQSIILFHKVSIPKVTETLVTDSDVLKEQITVWSKSIQCIYGVYHLRPHDSIKSHQPNVLHVVISGPGLAWLWGLGPGSEQPGLGRKLSQALGQCRPSFWAWLGLSPGFQYKKMYSILSNPEIALAHLKNLKHLKKSLVSQIQHLRHLPRPTALNPMTPHQYPPSHRHLHPHLPQQFQLPQRSRVGAHEISSHGGSNVGELL